MIVPKGHKIYALGREFKAGAELPKGLEKLLEKSPKKGRPVVKEQPDDNKEYKA